jgi:hypothetical protein
MLYWWPKIKDLGIPVPRTEIVEFGSQDFTSSDRLEERVNLIGLPVFIRTDLCSGKHDWNQSCFVDRMNVLIQRFAKVDENNVRWRMLGIEPKALVIREFLDLESSFRAFIGNMPITKERRYFVKDGKVICHHPYWPVTAFNNHPARMVDDINWKQKLEILNQEDDSESILVNYAEKVSWAVDGYWSIDFAKGRNGKWYLIDMALGENSYHWAGCKKI